MTACKLRLNNENTDKVEFAEDLLAVTERGKDKIRPLLSALIYIYYM